MSVRKSKKREPPAKMIIRRNAAPVRSRTVVKAEESERGALTHRIEGMDGSHVAAGIGAGALANVLGVITVGRGWIRAMLRNPRDRGVYVHGKIKNVRTGGKVKRVQADPSEVITIDVPEWRIVDDETWFAVHEIFQSRKRGSAPHGNHGRPAVKYPLSGIARCGHCGGSIGSAGRWWRKHTRVTAYACLQHHQRGKTVCPVTVYQSSTEIEAALLDYLRKHVLTSDVVEDVLAQVREEIAREFEGREVDTSALEKELRQMRQQQKRLARAIAMVDDAPELLSELQKRRTRIGYIEAKLAEAERSPDETSAQMAKIEQTARERLARLDQVMADDRAGLREVFLALFPEGLTFRAYQRENRQVWAISGAANLGGFNVRGDPKGHTNPC